MRARRLAWPCQVTENVILCVTAALVSAGLATAALAQSYPVKTVRVIVPTGPSGGADVQARLMSKRFTESMGQSNEVFDLQLRLV